MCGNAYTVLIEGAGFQNRGAWLMLESTIAAVRKFAPGAVVALPNGIYESNRVWCRQHDVRPFYDSSSNGGIVLLNLYRMLGKIMRCSMPASEQDIDLLLDAAGYKYTDKFGDLSEAAIRRQVAHYGRIASHRGRIVLLPQAFGPISDETIIRMYKECEPYLSRVYARDDESLRALGEIADKKSIVGHAPDFTCLFKADGVSLRRFALDQTYAVVVPNIRMITHVGKADADKYRAFIVSVVDSLSGKGLQVVLLNHGGAEDEGLIREVKDASRYPDKVVCINDATAEECKAIISKALLLMSSRFHGVVSGLVQKVPTFCTSWSHKYERLLEDYDLSANCLAVSLSLPYQKPAEN